MFEVCSQLVDKGSVTPKVVVVYDKPDYFQGNIQTHFLEPKFLLVCWLHQNLTVALMYKCVGCRNSKYIFESLTGFYLAIVVREIEFLLYVAKSICVFLIAKLIS